MERLVSAREANQKFSQMLREVRNGETYIITSHDTPVAKIMPVDSFDRASAAAQRSLFERLRGQRPVKVAKWSRDELYERGRDEDRR